MISTHKCHCEIIADFIKELDGDGNLRYNKKYYSYTARGSEQKIADGLSDMSYDVAQKYAKSNGVDIETAKEAVGEFRLYDQELTDSGSKAFTKFKKGLSYLNKRGGINVDFAVVEPNSSFNGALKDGVLYIGADTFENGKWAGTLVHEYMHVEEGTPEYEALVKHLEADESLFDSALTSVLGKSYGFDINRMRDIGRRIFENPDIYQTEIDSERKVQYAKKRRDPLLNNVFPMYEPFSKSGSEANRLAIDWVHRKDTKTGDQALISYHDRWYLIQKFDDSDLGYVIQRRVLKAEYNEIVKERKENDRNRQVKSISGSVDIIVKLDKPSYSFKGGESRAHSSEFGYRGENNQIQRMDKDSTERGERDRRDGSGDSSGSGAYQSRADLAVNQEELSEYIEFVSEVSAHMGELLLGTESFIDKIVRTDASLAEKILGKISDLKEAFGRIGDPEAQAQHKRLVDAEKLYLDAIEAAGKKYENGKIISVYDDEGDEEEAEYAKKQINTKDLPKIKKYIKISSKLYNILHKKVSALYSGVSDGFADGIAIEDGDTIYIIDSGKDNGKLDFGVREKLIKSNSLSRAEYIRRTNDEAIRRGFVDDGLSGRIGDRLYNDRASNRRQDEGLQLQAPQGTPKHNQGRVSSKNEETTKGIKYSFKEDSTENKNPTSYTKAEAEAMVDGIMESIFSFDGYHGEIKNRADVIRQAHAMLNSAEAGKRHSTALKFADYIIQHTVLAILKPTDKRKSTCDCKCFFWWAI